MLGELLSVLEWTHRFSDPLAWLVIGSLLASAALERYDRELARRAAVAGWGLFGVFWLTLVHHFVFTQRSIIEGVGSVAAVPIAFYVGYLLWQGRDSLFVLSRAIAFMGVIFFPFETLPVLRQFLVETVTRQVEFLLSMIGVEPQVVSGSHPKIQLGEKETRDYRNTFLFVRSGTDITYTILIACTGIGSMSIFGGLIMAVKAPWRRKLRALAVTIPVIYVLNLLRNVWIATTFGQQRLHVFPGVVSAIFGIDPGQQAMVSFYVGDRIVAQSLSVVALVGITYLLVRELPEVLGVIEDLLYLLTGSEYDLGSALEVAPARTDGGER